MSWLKAHLQELLQERHISIQAIATALKVERAYLSLIVHGHRIPSEELVRKLAAYFGEDPQEWAFRVRAEPVIEEFREKYPQEMVKYARRIQEPPPYSMALEALQDFYSSGKLPPFSTREYVPLLDIESYASETLRQFTSKCEFPPTFPLDAELLVRDVFQLQVHYDGEGLLDAIDPTLLGCLFPDGMPCPVLGIDRVIVVNQAPRYQAVTAEFTILHEAGHYLLHVPKDIISLERNPNYCRMEQVMSRTKVPPREWQSSRFAAEVMMPKEMVSWLLDGKKPGDFVNLEVYGPNLRRFFGASQQAIEHRLFTLGYRVMLGRYQYANVPASI